MKNLLLSLALLLVGSSISAQLYVAPNTTSSTDSYIYVDDEVLYVEQDINLVENAYDGTTEASIYLRNDAQLMQGGTTSTNTGTGFISIFQESSADAYDYTYWCSPISNTVGTGNKWFSKGMFYDEVTLTDSNQALTTIADNGSSTPLTISTRWFFKWAPSVQRWHSAMAGVPPGYGFIMKGTDVTVHSDPFADPNIQRYDFRGRPNNGDITLPIQVGVPFTDGLTYNYTLAGNPYPSALNLYDVFYDADNIEIDSFKFWDEDRSINSHYYIDNKGGYGTWLPGVDANDPGLYTVPTFLNYDNSGNPSGGSTGNGASFERLNSPVGQGFMIMANVIGDGFITIKNSHRRYAPEGAGNNSQFRNPNSGDAGSTVVGQGGGTNNANLIPHIRVQTFFGENTHMRDMVLAFRPESTDGYDRGMDATHPMDGAKAEAYFKIGTTTDSYQNLVIQTVPFEISKQVLIAFELEEETKFYVNVADEVNTPFEKAYLYDSVNGTYQEITNGKDAIQLLPAGVYEDRFYITFRGNTTIEDRNSDPLVVAQNELTANVDLFQNNKVATLEVSNPEGYDIKSVNIFDMNGKLVLSQENLGTQRRLAFPTANFSDGIYLVKLATTDNFAIDYKITVFNK